MVIEKKILPLLFIIIFCGCTRIIASGFQSHIAFTQNEITDHRIALSEITSLTLGCADRKMKDHQSFIGKWGITKFYGSSSEFAKMTKSDRERVFQIFKIPKDQWNSFSPTSCVGLVLECLEIGFQRSGTSDTWKKIRSFVRKNNEDGLALQHALRELGWKTLYWNPSLNENASKDAAEKKVDPENKKRAWGYHAYRWETIQSTRRYLNNTVDDSSSLVDFGTNPPKTTMNAPLFIGTAHGGYHVFLGTNGLVIESHASRQIDDISTIEQGPFNPIAANGFPSDGYHSGLIVIPPEH